SAAGSFYKLLAVDLSGNESPFALVGPGQTTDVSPGPTSFTFALDGARPNPARGGRMTIQFALPSGAPATLELFELEGRRIASREVGSLGAGRHALEIAQGRSLSAGVYLVRLTQGATERTVRVALTE